MSEFCHSIVALGEAAYIDAGQEDSVPEGLYWRVTPGGVTDLPAGPILLRHLRVEDPVGVEAIDAATQQPPEPGLRVTPDSPVLLLPRTPPGAMVGWALIQGEGNLRVAAISGRVAVGGAYVEISARDREPYAVAAHDMAGLVVSGDGRIIESSFFVLPTDFAADIGDIPGDPQVHAPPDDILPLHGFTSPGILASWKDRIALAAPRQPVPYALNDPGGPWSPDDELRRAEQIARSGNSVNDWVHMAYDALGSDARGLIEAASTDPGESYRVVAAQTAAAALGVGSLDPGVARWLGRSGILPHGLVNAPWQGVLLATVPLHLYRGRLPVGVTLADNATDDGIYDDRISAGGAYLDLLKEVESWPSHPEFGSPAVFLAHVPLPYFAGVTPSRPVQPVLAPPPFGPRWAPDEPRRWEQTIVIGAPPRTAYALRGPVPRSPVAFLRVDPQPQTLHPEIDGTGLAAPLLPGWDDDTGASTLAGSQDVPDGDTMVPITWSVALSDWIGRWGDPAGIDLYPPGPLPPAPPTIDAGLARQTPAGAAPASPGVVHVRFRVPTATVPGALPLRRVNWRADGTVMPTLDLTGIVAGPDAAALLVRAEFPAPATVPGQHHRVTIEADAEDNAGTRSGTVTFELDTSDSRALRPPTVAPHMLATSRRAADPSVSVTLTVRAPRDDGAYRFYLASESALRTAAALNPLTAATRAARAQQLNVQNPATARAASMLAVSEPVPVKAGVATARLDVPAGTVDVLAARAVPVTAELDTAGRVVRDGVEPPFASVKPVFVVVPYDEVPPTPELTLTRAGEAEAAGIPVTATVVVRGVQAAVLNRYAQEPIQARFVEASTDGDPWFWPQIAVADLAPSPADAAVFAGTATIHVPAWSRAGVAVAVRYPDEDMVVPGVDVVVAPELSATGPQGDRVESPWGPISVPAWIDVDGVEPGVGAESEVAGPVHVRATDLPQLVPGAPTFVMHVYSAASGALLEVAAGAVTPLQPELNVDPLALGGIGAQFSVVFETPFGALLSPLSVSV
ncbi:hypothetical protein EV580_0636 [Mycobacterium sp. BK086]|uniref:hypothetical protein n=1 Tax=Mycobacterium sp. BK086 TaxID=2512165 RepID=UPI00105C8177|nr:hypothetical protein [Mycobacterium sp. BK086]TDO17463.1 hypothetical protein EV580_0636 [Mycobacterium sp. BK086]